MKITYKGKAGHVEFLSIIDTYKANWHLWECKVCWADGTETTGTIQGDEHMVADDTFEPDDG